jgi:putative alpha-1,2-mannosidase
VPANTTIDLEMRVAISFISADLAKANFDAADITLGKRRFEALADRARSSWCTALDGLSVSAIDSSDAELETLLYSANYRAQLTPTDYTEAGGVYLGLDKAVHSASRERAAMYPSSTASKASPKVDRFYSDLSLWDTFRTLHPWVLLTDEPMATGILRSMSEMTAQQNGFPRWVLANVDISCMVGLHGSALALEAGLVGLGKEFDLVGMQKILVNQSTTVSMK